MMTDEEKWKAVSENDEGYDGAFLYAVKSTCIFCRPSCRSKVPRRDNVIFFENNLQAKEAGYRPCKRCRPDLLEYKPVKEIAEKAKQLMDLYYADNQILKQELTELGITGHRRVEIFKEQYGITPSVYLNSLRLKQAKAKLTNTDEDIVEIAYSVGFHSLSAFYHFFRKSAGASPASYRKDNTPGKENT